MSRYVLVRLGQAVFVLWAAYTAAFALLYLLPGDPIAIMAGGGLAQRPLTPEELLRIRQEYGFDEPVPIQYLHHLGALFRGDLGSSVSTGQSVTSMLSQALPSTFALAVWALLVALVLGVGVAFVASFTRSVWLRQSLMSLPSIGVSLPTFWVGLMLLQLFSFKLGWFPSGGNGSGALVLPAVTLAIPSAALIAQVLGKSLLGVLDQPFIEVARSKGLGRLRIHFRHVFRNATGPALALVGLLVGNLFAGAVIVETVFARNGLGRITISAVNARDIPVVLGVVLFSAAAFVIANLVVDLVYPLLDPRVARREGSS